MSDRLSFTGHQTFPLRYAWLPKGVCGLASSPALFSRADALVSLGVGKNMVAAIRYWCEATGMVGAAGLGDPNAPSRLGNALLAEAGWDPYLEDIGTLWLLHWQLTRRGARTSTWHLAFTTWNRALFTREELVAWLIRVGTQSGARRLSVASIRRDVDVFLRTYVSRTGKSRVPEESFDCPLTELGLIGEPEPGLFEFRRSEQPTLPSPILAYAILDYWNATAASQTTLSFERIMFGPGSPGGAFQLTDVGLSLLLDQLPSKASIEVDESAGMRRLVRKPGRLVEPI